MAMSSPEYWGSAGYPSYMKMGSPYDNVNNFAPDQTDLAERKMRQRRSMKRHLEGQADQIKDLVNKNHKLEEDNKRLRLLLAVKQRLEGQE